MVASGHARTQVRSSHAWLPDNSSHRSVRCARVPRCHAVQIADVLKDKLSKLPPAKIKAACEELLEAMLPNKGARM